MKIDFLNGDEAARLAARHIGYEQDEPGAAFGAALAGTRVVGVTNGHGLRAALAQLAVQAGMRLPMVLNVGCEHAELQPALNSGWIIFCARDAQAVYDLNLAAVKVSEHAQVRLPVLIAYDGRVTRHEKQRLGVFEDASALAGFLGSPPASATPLDAAHPATFGARLASDLELSQAMQAARRVIPEVLAELARLTGRSYPLLDAHAMEGAEEALVVLNTTGTEAAGAVGRLSPNVLRPFPTDEFRARLRTVKRITVADRSGIVAMELRSALQGDPQNQTEVIEAVAPADKRAPEARPGLPAIPAPALSRGMAKIRRNEQTGRLEVELEPLWKMTSVPSRLAPGHGACPGCGAFATLHQIYKVLEGDIVALVQSGCAAEVSMANASTAHRISVVHYPRANGAAVLSGMVEAATSKDTTFLMITGDGAMEAGIGAALAAAGRNVRMMVLEYDNHGRMSEGDPLRPSALGRRVWTSDIFAACHLPYLFTAAEGYPEDLMRKVAKGQWYAKNEGMVYGKILSYCPLHWQAADDAAQPVLQAAIDSCFFPLYEVEHGQTVVTYDPDAVNRRRPVGEWLKLMGHTADLPEDEVLRIQAATDRRWARLKAMHEHPLL